MGNTVERKNRRSQKRKNLSAPIKARFRMEIEGEISNISSEGVALTFKPLDQEALASGGTLSLHLDMNNRLVTLDGSIRQCTETNGIITVGLRYDRSQLAIFNMKK